MLVASAALDRFLGKTEVGEGCWLWKGGSNGLGYGRFMPDGRRSGSRRLVYAHRFAYEQFVGPIPEGFELDHTCRDPRCVRPDHLEPVTHAENLRRGQAARETGLCHNGHPWDEVGPTGLTNLAYQRARGKYLARYCRRCVRERVHKKGSTGAK